MSTSVCMSEMRCPALGPLCGGSVSRLEYRDPCTLVNERNANQRLDLKLSTVRASEVASPATASATPPDRSSRRPRARRLPRSAPPRRLRFLFPKNFEHFSRTF